VKPFLFLTKERAIAPQVVALFRTALADTYRVVVPIATHDSFTDGPRLRPRLLPFDADADAVIATERQVVATFLDRYLRPDGLAAFSVFDPPADVTIEMYPAASPRH
jgi:uroporphyrinogen-III synthase